MQRIRMKKFKFKQKVKNPKKIKYVMILKDYIQ